MKTYDIDKMMLKLAACGFFNNVAVTFKCGFLFYMMPCWVHKASLVIRCALDPQYAILIEALLMEVLEAERAAIDKED